MTFWDILLSTMAYRSSRESSSNCGSCMPKKNIEVTPATKGGIQIVQGFDYTSLSFLSFWSNVSSPWTLRKEFYSLHAANVQRWVLKYHDRRDVIQCHITPCTCTPRLQGASFAARIRLQWRERLLWKLSTENLATRLHTL